jgi:hypothetical protein
MDIKTMAEKLTKKEKGFIKDIVKGETGTKAILNNYDTDNENVAGVMAHENLRKPKIQKELQRLADRIPDELLEEVHLQGLKASRTIKSTDDGDIIEPDYAVRHKYLDSAYKIKGTYAPDKLAFTDKDGEDLISKEKAEELLALLNK